MRAAGAFLVSLLSALLLVAGESPFDQALNLARDPDSPGLAKAEAMLRAETQKQPPTPTAYQRYAEFLRHVKHASIAEVVAVVKEGLRKDEEGADALARLYVDFAGEALSGAEKAAAEAEAITFIIEEHMELLCELCAPHSQHRDAAAKAIQKMEANMFKKNEPAVADALQCCSQHLAYGERPKLAEVVLTTLLTRVLGVALPPGAVSVEPLGTDGWKRELAHACLGLLESAQQDVMRQEIHRPDGRNDLSSAYRRLVATWHAEKQLLLGSGSKDAAAWSKIVQKRKQDLVKTLDSDTATKEDVGTPWRDPLFDVFTACPRVASSTLTSDTFLEQYIDMSQAVVVTGLDNMRQDWLEFLRTLPDLLEDREVEVDVPVGASGRLNVLVASDAPFSKTPHFDSSYVEDLFRKATEGAERRGEHVEELSPLVSLRPYNTHMKAKDFFALMEQPELLPPGMQPYLHQTDVGKLLPHRPELVDLTAVEEGKPRDAGAVPALPAFAAHLAPRLLLRNVWLAPRGVQTDPHFDPSDNLLLVVDGEKDMLIWPPTAYADLGYRSTRNMYPEHVAPREMVQRLASLARGTAPSDARRDLPREGFPSEFGDVYVESAQRPPFDYQVLLANLSGSQDVERGQHAQAKRWLAEHACRATLGPGEAIFVPVFWTHAVHGRSDGVVAQVNFWFEHSRGTIQDAITKHRARPVSAQAARLSARREL